MAGLLLGYRQALQCDKTDQNSTDANAADYAGLRQKSCGCCTERWQEAGVSQCTARLELTVVEAGNLIGLLRASEHAFIWLLPSNKSQH